MEHFTYLRGSFRNDSSSACPSSTLSRRTFSVLKSLSLSSPSHSASAATPALVYTRTGAKTAKPATRASVHSERDLFLIVLRFLHGDCECRRSTLYRRRWRRLGGYTFLSICPAHLMRPNAKVLEEPLTWLVE